jgi:arabinoxylan arabinofuranohydrolase
MAVKYFCSWVILTVFLSLATAYGDTNILENPGFENGTKGWSDRACKIEVVTTPVHTGKASAKASGRAETWQGIKQSLLGKISNGNTYKISAWVRLENADSDTVTVSIEQTDDEGTRYINVGSGTVNNRDWMEISGEFTLTVKGALKTLDVYFEGPEPDVNFFVDDVAVSGSSSAGQADPNAPKQQTKADVTSDSVKINSTHEAALVRQRY